MAESRPQARHRIKIGEDDFIVRYARKPFCELFQLYKAENEGTEADASRSVLYKITKKDLRYFKTADRAKVAECLCKYVSNLALVYRMPIRNNNLVSAVGVI